MFTRREPPLIIQQSELADLVVAIKDAIELEQANYAPPDWHLKDGKELIAVHCNPVVPRPLAQQKALGIGRRQLRMRVEDAHGVAESHVSDPTLKTLVDRAHREVTRLLEWELHIRPGGEDREQFNSLVSAAQKSMEHLLVDERSRKRAPEMTIGELEKVLEEWEARQEKMKRVESKSERPHLKRNMERQAESGFCWHHMESAKRQPGFPAVRDLCYAKAGEFTLHALRQVLSPLAVKSPQIRNASLVEFVRLASTPLTAAKSEVSAPVPIGDDLVTTEQLADHAICSKDSISRLLRSNGLAPVNKRVEGSSGREPYRWSYAAVRPVLEKSRPGKWPENHLGLKPRKK